MTAVSVFSAQHDRSWPYKFAGQLHVDQIMAGTPADQKVVEGWLKAKMGIDDSDELRLLVAQTVSETGQSVAEATPQVIAEAAEKGKCVFKRDDVGLYIEDRHLKAALKEAVSVALATGKIQQKGWGTTKKWITGFFPEHVFVDEKRLYLGVTEATGVEQQFVHSRFGSSIQYNEYVRNAVIDFTIVTDFEFSDQDWAMIWTTGERQGIGACRSQGYGTYAVTKWERITQRSRGRGAA